MNRDLNKALYDYQMTNTLPSINLVIYSDLINWTIEDLIRSLPLVILYNNSSDSGHYTCLIKNDSEIMFFDPYGKEQNSNKMLYPDNELRWKDMRKYSGSSKLKPLLEKLKGIVPIYANDTRYQQYDPKISTCGWHCLMRIIFQDLNEENYKLIMEKFKKLTKSKSFDETVVKLLKDVIKF